MFVSGRICVNVALDILTFQFELLKNLLHHFAVGERVEQVFGINFSTPKFHGRLSGLLHYLFGVFGYVLLYVGGFTVAWQWIAQLGRQTRKIFGERITEARE
jgi:hypothetical protein